MRLFYQQCSLLLFFLTLGQVSFGQKFGDEWIEPSQKYYKVKTDKSGLLRISYQVLLGHQATELLANPAKIQVWHRGRQVTLSAVLKNPGAGMQQGDNLFLYGRKNDGQQDALLYRPSTTLYNPYSSLFSDTSAYFLTLSEKGPWLRADSVSSPRYSQSTSSSVQQENLISYQQEYWQKGYEGEDAMQVHFEPGEGWQSFPDTKLTFSLEMPGYEFNRDTTYLEVLAADRYREKFTPRFYILGKSTTDTLFLGASSEDREVFNAVKMRFALTRDLSPYLTNGILKLHIAHSEASVFSVSYIRLRYPATAKLSLSEKGNFFASVHNLKGVSFENNSKRLTFCNITSETSWNWIKDSTGGNKTYLPRLAAGSMVHYFAQADSVAILYPVSFRKYTATDSLFVILTHESLLSSSREYAAYRHSPAGGKYDTLVAQMHQIRDQFGYGEESPLCIRRFLNRLKNQQAQAPDYFFIIGLGLTLDNRVNQWDDRLPTSYKKFNLILPAGVPGGDFGYSFGLDGTEKSISAGADYVYYSNIPTGRLSVKDNQTVLNYLDKVKEHEALSTDQPWRRNVLHLSGGYQYDKSAEYNQEQIKLFRAYVNGFSSIIRQPYLGANVTTQGRTTGGATELIDVSAQVNNGVSLITFLGHSSRSITDISIGYLSDGKNLFGYNNKGKYPMLYLNGCSSGNTFFDPDIVNIEKSLITDWVHAKQKGAIAGLANTSTGLIRSLKHAIENMYISSYTDSANFAKSIGEQLVASQKRFATNYSEAEVPVTNISSLSGTTTLQGDPGIHLHPTPKVNYALSCDRLQLKPYNQKRITVQTDSFFIQIPVVNYGLYSRQPFKVAVKRSYANQTKSTLYEPQTFLPVRDKDTIYFKIKGLAEGASGENVFEITIDPANETPEMSKTNNVCSFSAYIPGTTMQCLYPKKFSIVSHQPVTFVAQSSTISIKERTFYFEMDTNYRFNSPFKRTFSTTSFNLPSWPDQILLPDIPERDSTVYFWRVKYTQPEAEEDTAFGYSSFLYVKNSPGGWSQSKPAQFFEDDARALQLDSGSGRWNFRKIAEPLKVLTMGADPLTGSPLANFMSFKNVPMIFGGNCDFYGIDGFYLMAINSTDLSTRVTKVRSDRYYQCDPFTGPFVSRFINLKPGIAESFNFLHQVLKDTIQTGETVIMMNIGNAGFSHFPDSLKTLLKSKYGASNRLDSLKDGHPYILLSQKEKGRLAERYPVSEDSLSRTKELLRLDTMVYSNGYSGHISSTLIGPATEWGNFFYKLAQQPDDSVKLDIAGVTEQGKETVLVSQVTRNNLPLAGQVNASQYPYLRLHAYKETKALSTPQLLKWQVIYKGVPEGTLLFPANAATEYGPFSSQEGDTSKVFRFRFKNVSGLAFEKDLLVRYTITNQQKVVVKYDTLHKKLPQDSTWTVVYKPATVGLAGDNVLEVFFNPSPGQKEETKENNRYTIPFSVTTDKTHPVLDVAFDGQHIMNRDIVIPTPTISITVDDENKYLIAKDTSGLVVELQKPCGQANCPFERVVLAGKEVTVYPAGSNNKLEVQYKPEKLADGIYTLRVQAKDASGNLAGSKPYTIQFEVVSEVAVTRFLPYPNPFSTKMWFVYTLTGELPDQIRIQIMTVTGKIVRQIFQDELGPLRIGTHRTDFTWDGTDDFGDQLANGLYLYKVSVRKGGEELKNRGTVNDNLFTNGYGKLYILR